MSDSFRYSLHQEHDLCWSDGGQKGRLQGRKVLSTVGQFHQMQHNFLIQTLHRFMSANLDVFHQLPIDIAFSIFRVTLEVRWPCWVREDNGYWQVWCLGDGVVADQVLQGYTSGWQVSHTCTYICVYYPIFLCMHKSTSFHLINLGFPGYIKWIKEHIGDSDTCGQSYDTN